MLTTTTAFNQKKKNGTPSDIVLTLRTLSGTKYVAIENLFVGDLWYVISDPRNALPNPECSLHANVRRYSLYSPLMRSKSIRFGRALSFLHHQLWNIQRLGSRVLERESGRQQEKTGCQQFGIKAILILWQPLNGISIGIKEDIKKAQQATCLQNESLFRACKMQAIGFFWSSVTFANKLHHPEPLFYWFSLN